MINSTNWTTGLIGVFLVAIIIGLVALFAEEKK